MNSWLLANIALHPQTVTSVAGNLLSAKVGVKVNEEAVLRDTTKKCHFPCSSHIGLCGRAAPHWNF